MENLSLWQKIVIAYKAFREADLMASLPDGGDWSDFETRRIRYDILWSMYENTTYSNVHTWAQALRNRYGMYKYVRNIYNPTAREAEFWEGMIWGGWLNTDDATGGAIPVIVPEKNKANEKQLRAAITNFWKRSNMAIRKDTIPLWGAALGDVFIRVVDNPEQEKLYAEMIHPSKISHIVKDNVGYVKAYTIEEKRIDNEGRIVNYKETAEREKNSEQVIFTTYANGKPYGYGGNPATWSTDYGFIPLVAIQHRDVGLEWGYAEVHKILVKIREADELASKLHDQIRKTIDPVWLFNFAKPKKVIEQQVADASRDRPQTGREEIPSLYVPEPTAQGQALIGDANIDGALNTLDKLLKEIERELPELQDDIWTANGETSGVAISKAREKVEGRVVTRRQNYDAALVRVHQMGIAIGGMRGYKDYEGFDLNSFKAGALDHNIDQTRPIFSVSKDGEQAIYLKELEIIEKMIDVLDVTPEAALKERGWTDEKIKEILKAREDNNLKKNEDKIPDVEQ